jgi:DNA-binding winged helix-turn-helix (wHTH) protein
MARTYTLGPFRLDAEADVLFCGAEPLALGQRAVALLRVLVERAGDVVSKDTLLDTAWPGLSVEESNLTVQMAALRRALGEGPGGARACGVSNEHSRLVVTLRFVVTRFRG